MNRVAWVLCGLVSWAGALIGQENSVTISPLGFVVVSPNTVVITITWCGYPPPSQNDMDLSTRLIKVNGADSTASFDLEWDPAACGFEGSIADEVLYTSTGTITVDQSTGPVTVWAEVSNAMSYQWSAVETFYPPAPRRGLAVLAEDPFVVVDPSSTRGERFRIWNRGTATDTFSLSLTGCGSGAIGSSCTGVPGSVILASGDSTTITAEYTASGTAGLTGVLRLKATKGGLADSAWVDVTVGATPAVGVSIVGLAPGKGDLLPREACVTVALTEAAASECGDLRLAHPLPSVRTMGTIRAPALLYNSQHARPKPVVLANVRLSGSVALPDSVIACIKVAGNSRGCERWAGAAWGAAGNTRRIAVRGDDSWTAGEYDITLEVTAKNGNQGPYTATERLFIVDRSTSPFGAGWWLAGLEQLTVVSSTVLIWTGGDGSVRRYVKDGSVFRAPKFTALDSIVVDGSDYIRRTAEHAQVRFNSTGQHIKTTNSLGHETVFTYTSTRVTGIQVPTLSGTVQYTLVYDGNNRLDSIAAPGSRGTKLFRTAARVDSIRDPDGNRVRFASGSGANQYVIVGRTDRRGNATSFAYDSANRLSGATRPLSNLLGLTAAESRGLTPIAVDSGFAMIDGPRTDVDDRTRLWINGYGAPERIVAPLGQATRVVYNGTWPGLADSVLAPNRLGSRTYYQASRGLPDSMKVYNPVGGGQDARVKYTWHGSLNRPTKVETQTGVSAWLTDEFSYNGDATLAWQQRGTSATRVNYAYTGSGLPERLVLPGNDTVLFTYNTLGNLRKERSPAGALTLHFNDALGRDSVTITPRGTGSDGTDSAQVVAKGVRQLVKLDRMDRDTASVISGPELRLPNNRKVAADTVRTRSSYDANGNLLSVTRGFTSTLDSIPGGLYEANASEWQYDALNRVTQQQDAGSGWTSFTLDAAGNATTIQTPRGHYITASYDALNRQTQRVVPQVTFSTSPCVYMLGISCGYTFPILEGPTLCVAVDTLRFGYDAAGNLTRADNNWARIRRAYTPNGLVSHDTLRTRRYETEAPNPCGGGDKRAAGDSPLASDWSAHVYALQYEYDLAGRRTVLHHPDQLDPCSGRCAQTYTWDGTFGTLSSLAHPGASGTSVTTSFTWDNQLRLVTTNHPSTGTARSTTLTYDPDGRVHTRTGPVTFDTLGYDASGRIVNAAVALPTSGWIYPELAYNGLGALQWADGATDGVTAEEFKTDGLGNRLWLRDNQLVDGINRTRYHTVASSTGQLTGMGLGTGACNPPGAGGGSCHPAWYEYEFAQDHDASGNVVATWGLDTRGTSAENAEQVPEESRSYYNAAQQLTYYNRHLGWSTPGEGAGSFVEYRYDALGRRVYSRTRRPSTCSYPCEAYVQRWVWDGDQVLYEIRSSGKDGVDPNTMNQEGGVASGDDYNLYGRIAYAHAMGIDEPVGVLKRTNSTWYYLTPHANWRGEWSYGTLGNGNICTTVATECPGWPGFQQSMDGWDKGSIPPTYTVWWGDLLRQGSDASRLQYRRNRYYDPQTGRFTQQDPIGLAGGLNLYGFAAGDPVNFADPFGLMACDPPGSPKCRDALQKPLIGEELFLAAGGLLVGGVRAAFGAATRAASGTATFFRGVSQAEAADIAGTGSLRAGAAAAGNTGKYLTNSITAASQWGAQNGPGYQVLRITVRADATKAFTSLGRIDGIGQAWWAPIESLRGARIEAVEQVLRQVVPR